MTHERWRDVSRLFNEALTRESEARATFLADACRGDDDLRRDVESLLAQHASNASLTGPVMVGAAPVPVDLIDRQVGSYSIPNADSDQAGPVIWTQDLTARTAPRALSSAKVPNVGGLDVSPDGKWIAYHTRESGQLQVYVEAFPGPGPRIQVSNDTGGSPVWRADGRELFYARANEGPAAAGYRGTVGLMAVSVTTQGTLGFGTPRQLFAGYYVMNAPARGYDVTPDGQRFVFFQARERAAVVIRELSVVQNWGEELKRRVPSR